jgi:hypothetical protein
MKYLFLSLSSIFTTGCISSYGNVDYTQHNISSSDMPNKRSTNITVKSSKRSFIWTSCDDLAKEAVVDLVNQAKSFGGTSVSHIKFENGGNLEQTPVCESGLGWFLLYFIPGLGPWVQVSAAEGIVMKDDKNLEIISAENKSYNSKQTNNCASIVSGDIHKLVCGDSKDRVIEKWGKPDSASPTLGRWHYGLCILEFTQGKLNNYGGTCELQNISNDSFEGNRIIISDL